MGRLRMTTSYKRGVRRNAGFLYFTSHPNIDLATQGIEAIFGSVLF